MQHSDRLGNQSETPSAASLTERVPAALAGGTHAGSSGPGNGNGVPFTVSIPSVGSYRTVDHRYYWNGKGPVPSVTTILKVLDKPAVTQWAKRTVAEIAVNRHVEIRNRLELGESRDEVTRWLAGMPDHQADTAAKLGSSVHLLADVAGWAENAGAAFEVTEQEKPYLAAFQGFLGHLRGSGAEIISSEKMVWSEVGYAGTYDLLLRYQDALWLIDIKTSKGYYPEYALQLIAYGCADYIILPDNPTPYPMPQIQRYGVLHLRPDQYPDTGWRLVEYPLQDSDYLAFLGALEIYNWKQQGRYTKRQLSEAQKG